MPESGSSMPQIMRSSTDFPEPLPPRMARFSPPRKSNDTSSRMRLMPFLER
ncbi:Uncharacterised protein [Bordetella pertussis]|nr:Uncharacterised protein [Bordetella pertussis]CFO81991.1 Uncharacterised protein [Bordetella pertussis]CFU95581.1 Uncharacterised protein [Bordetella pertussis]CPM70055.1 Uncharacterised protein [Bordetella pertussis]CPO32729.1 Uncharacterised protein [Bordetella pertussis]